MTDHIVFDGARADRDEGSGQHLRWEAPEIAVVAILTAFFIIVVGGLAAGIDVSTGSQQPYFDQAENIWNAIQFGSSWAGPVLAFVLLGVVGLCWWQIEAWSAETRTAPEEPSPAADYIRRAQRLSAWALGSLVVNMVGAVAGLIALVAFDIPSHPGQVAWSRVIGVGAGVAAVTGITVAGVLIVSRLTSTVPAGAARLASSTAPESSLR